MEGQLNKPSSFVADKGEKAAKFVGHEHGQKDSELESTVAEMGQVRQENERLKTILQRIEKDYQSLQLRVFDFQEKETSRKSRLSGIPNEETDEPELVSLCLGRSPHGHSGKDAGNNCKNKEDDSFKNCLTLGFCSETQIHKKLASDQESDPSAGNNSEEPKELGGAGESRSPRKAPKSTRNEDDNEQSYAKRARVSVRARCDYPTMNDGCQWRKYGQKISKGNPRPRAYYRCTVAPSCPVRKQVQRCSEDMSILITTYEGTHNHPLPIAATAMASTTTAAASMLLSGSSASQPGLGCSAMATSSVMLGGLNFLLKQCFPNSSSTFYPTVTLDLTKPATSRSTYFNSFFTSHLTSASVSSQMGLTFSNPESAYPPNMCFHHGTEPTDKTQFGSADVGKQFLERFYPQFVEKKNQAFSQASLTESLTMAIKSDPSFRSVIATAVATMAGSPAVQGTQSGDIAGQNSRLIESVQALISKPMTQNGNGCASSYSNRLPSSDSQTGSLTFLRSPLPFPISKSPSRIGDQIN